MGNAGAGDVWVHVSRVKRQDKTGQYSREGNNDERDESVWERASLKNDAEDNHGQRDEEKDWKPEQCLKGAGGGFNYGVHPSFAL